MIGGRVDQNCSIIDPSLIIFLAFIVPLTLFGYNAGKAY